jgi:hypothetical protein
MLQTLQSIQIRCGWNNKIDRIDKIDETFQKKINNGENKNSKKRMSR